MPCEHFYNEGGGARRTSKTSESATNVILLHRPFSWGLTFGSIQCPLRNQKSPAPQGQAKKKSPKRNGDQQDEVVEWVRARGPAGGNAARNATNSNTWLENRTESMKRTMCVCSCKGVVPGHAGDTDIRGTSREFCLVVDVARGVANHIENHVKNLARKEGH